jgi:hypothetical protein
MIIATIKSTVNIKIQSCFGCFDQLFKNLSLNPLLSIQGFSVSGVMVSQKTGLISGPDCPCLNDYKFPVQLPQQHRSQQEELSTLEPRLFSGKAAQLVGYSSGIGGI